MTPHRSPRRRRIRTLLLGALLSLLLPFLLLPTATAAPLSTVEYLVAADPTAQALHVYRTSDLKRTGTLDDIQVSAHAGSLALPDGRLLVIDDAKARLDAIRIDGRGRPQIVDRADIPGQDWDGATWFAADPSLRYVVFSGEADAGSTPVTVVDLRTFVAHQVRVPVAPDSSGTVAETQVYLAGHPLQVVWTTGGQFRSTPLARVLADKPLRVTSTAPVGVGTHGPVVSRRGDAVFSTTADGFDGAAISGATLGSPRSVAYSPTRNVVQSYRPRLASDERTVWGGVAEDTGLSPSEWADTRNDVNLVDTVAFTSRLVRMPDGLAGRLAMSDRYAALSTISPDGDALTLMDAAPASPTYGRIVGTVALPSSTHGPVAGVPTTGTQTHFTALDPAGRTAFVTNGGDGRISVVDTATRRLTRTLSVPTPLTGGGYLTVVHPGAPLHDLVAR